MSIIKAAGSGDQASTGFYSFTIDNSVRMSDASNSQIYWQAGTPSSGNIWTASFWFKKYSIGAGQAANEMFGAGSGGAAYMFWAFDGNEKFTFQTTADGNKGNTTGSPVFRDTNAWYHMVLRADTTQSTQANRLRVYLNGEQLTVWGTDSIGTSTWDFINQSGFNQYWGGASGIANGNPGCNFYLADINFCDGQSYDASYFGETKDGIWVPIDPSVTYGNNGYRLEFKQTGTSANASGIGADTSGNDNHFTVAGIAADDVVPDSPTNNFPTWNPLQPQGAAQGTNTLSEGNLKAGNSLNAYGQSMGSMSVLSGKWYTETYVSDTGYPSWHVGWTYGNRFEAFDGGTNSDEFFAGFGYFTGSNVYFSSFGEGYADLSIAWSGIHSAGDAPTTGDVIGCAADFDNGKFWWHINGEYLDVGSGTGNPANGTNPARTFTVATYADKYKSPWVMNYNGSFILNAGQDSTFAGAISAGGNSDENGNGDFKYSVPSGFLALCTANLPDPTIGPGQSGQADDNFNTVLYTGDGTNGQAITGVGHQPDFLWIKSRSGTAYHELHDSVRGAGKRLFSNDTAAESDVGTVSSFDTDGFTVSRNSAYDGTNQNTVSFVGWNWKAGGTASSNSNGSITSSVSANQDAGFSIVSYTGTGSAATVGHGLSSAPEVIITKNRDDSGNWMMYHANIASDAETDYINLNLSNAAADGASVWNDTAPTSSVFSVGTNGNSNGSSDDMIAYCFHSVDGFSNMGSYTGNFNANGPFIYTGFRPAWLMLKRTDSADSWLMRDNKRDPDNVTDQMLNANASTGEYTDSTLIDFVSNGFKLRHQNSLMNASGGNFIYLCFAEAPFKFANAR